MKQKLKVFLDAVPLRALNMLLSCGISKERRNSVWDFPKSICHGALLCRETWVFQGKIFRNSCLGVLLLNQVRFAQCVASQSTEMPRFAAKRVYSQARQARKQKNKSQNHLAKGKGLGVFMG